MLLRLAVLQACVTEHASFPIAEGFVVSMHRLYQACGTMGAEFAAAAFFGPSHRAIQRYRQAFEYPMRFGWDAAFVSISKRLLNLWGLDGAPVTIVEDGTALQARYAVNSRSCKSRPNSCSQRRAAADEKCFRNGIFMDCM